MERPNEIETRDGTIIPLKKLEVSDGIVITPPYTGISYDDFQDRMILRQLVRAFYRQQADRIRMGNQFDALLRADYIPVDKANILRAQVLGIIEDGEKALVKQIEKTLKKEPIWTEFCVHVPGIGPKITASLIGEALHPLRFLTVSSYWKWSGLDVRDGRAPRRKPGEKANWNQWMRRTAYMIGKCFVRTGKGLGAELYHEYREKMIRLNRGIVFCEKCKSTKGGPLQIYVGPGESPPDGCPKCGRPMLWNQAHQDLAAVRYAAKIFLACFLAKWREQAGLQTPDPYILAKEPKLHTHKYSPEDFMVKKLKRGSKRGVKK